MRREKIIGISLGDMRGDFEVWVELDLVKKACKFQVLVDDKIHSEYDLWENGTILPWQEVYERASITMRKLVEDKTQSLAAAH